MPSSLLSVATLPSLFEIAIGFTNLYRPKDSVNYTFALRCVDVYINTKTPWRQGESFLMLINSVKLFSGTSWAERIW